MMSNSEASAENPLMALVDAAASIFDKITPTEGHEEAASKIVTDSGSCSEGHSQEESTSSVHDALGKKQTFAELLMAALEDESNSGVFEWMPDGKSFAIIDPKKFTMEVMPKVFSIRNMSSFVRKLGRWGFQRIHEKESRSSDVFIHRQFQKGKWELCSRIRCVGRLQRGPPPVVLGQAAPHEHGSPRFVVTTTPKCYTSSPEVSVLSNSAVVTPQQLPPAASVADHKREILLQEQLARIQALRSGSPAYQAQMLESAMASQVVAAALETLRRDEESARQQQALQQQVLEQLALYNAGLTFAGANANQAAAVAQLARAAAATPAPPPAAVAPPTLEQQLLQLANANAAASNVPAMIAASLGNAIQQQQAAAVSALQQQYPFLHTQLYEKGGWE